MWVDIIFNFILLHFLLIYLYIYLFLFFFFFFFGGGAQILNQTIDSNVYRLPVEVMAWRHVALVRYGPNLPLDNKFLIFC